jgi:hypothetical protein
MTSDALAPRIPLQIIWRNLAAVCDWRLPAVLALTAALIVVATLVPREYGIAIGEETGFANDQPFIAGFSAPDRGPFGAFRWSSERSVVRVPGLGTGSVIASFRVLPIPQNALAADGPRVLEVWSGERAIADLPLHPTGTRFHLLLAAAPNGAEHVLDLRSTTWQPVGDQRRLGVPVGMMTFARAGAQPPAAQSLSWLVVVGLAWIAVRGVWGTREAAVLAVSVVAGLIGIIHIVDPPRAALGAVPAAIALLVGIGLTLPLRLLGTKLLDRLAIPWTARALRYLLLMALIVCVMRYGGKLLPGAMPGDINFHSNRFDEVVNGNLYLDARNRGASFPYPPGYYLVLAPLTLAGIDRRSALPLGTAVLDALSPFLIYILAQRLQGRNAPAGEPASILAAGLYAAAGAGLLATWWNFSTHIFTQFAYLVLLVGITAPWPAAASMVPGRPRHWVAVALLACLFGVVFLGHFGFVLNTVLSIGVSLMIGFGYRGHVGRRQRVVLAISAASALGFATLTFYSLYVKQFVRQLQLVGAGTEVNAASDATLFQNYWHTILEAGLRDHYGVFLPPLALVGIMLVAQRRMGSEAGRVLNLCLGTLAVIVAFALLPFISGANLSSRWLSFAGWLVAVGAAPAVYALWRRGSSSRIFVGCVIGYTLWISLTLWLLPMVWRIRPPEPF